ncbi:hypothetical protein CFOL_v3_03237 [Cephalotus follicularis]|uniref:Protein FAR1-RELATED SEQUENCE n=1 Tax=Cephalotus follicularis TaxID=3775 RepID=A0A1Q3AVC8_CEPFO|nr:hypothetical protein CFOL_v3_03237 [Cephalotus follicularis]
MFAKLLYDCETEDDFKFNWREMVEKYDVLDNRWLNRLFGLRDKWSPTFSRDTFSANIRSTHESESTNSVFQGMSCKIMSLTEFVRHYEENVKKMHEIEHIDDIILLEVDLAYLSLIVEF